MPAIVNDTARDKFFGRLTHEVADTIWKQITTERLGLIDPRAHEANVFCDFFDRASNRDVVPGWFRLPPLSTWALDGTSLQEKKAEPPTLRDPTMDSFLAASDCFFANLEGKKIAVQLSGGLDTSLIIGIMRHLSIPHTLIGLANARYEFRTESRIQQLLAAHAEECVLIDHESCLPYAELSDIPKHQWPDGNAITFAADRAMAGACAQRGIDTLIAGSGGDVLLVSAITENQYLWKPNYFYNTFLRQYVYQPAGVELLPFFADAGVVACMRGLRMNQARDSSKRWARRFFAQYLPMELVDYDYKADFWGVYVDGLSDARATIVGLHERAFAATGNAYFAPRQLELLLNSPLNDCDPSLYRRLDARISLAAWLSGLTRAD